MKTLPLKYVVAYVGAAAALATVFAMYLQPDFMLLLAQQVWACF